MSSKIIPNGRLAGWLACWRLTGPEHQQTTSFTVAQKSCRGPHHGRLSLPGAAVAEQPVVGAVMREQAK